MYEGLTYRGKAYRINLIEIAVFYVSLLFIAYNVGQRSIR